MTAAIGIRRLNQVVSHYGKLYNKRNFTYIQNLGSFGDLIKSTSILKHLRIKDPNDKNVILYGVDERYFEQFEPFALIVGIVIFNLPPNNNKDDLKFWMSHVKSLGVKSIFDLTTDGKGNSFENMLSSMKISNFDTPKRPFFPYGSVNLEWSNKYLIDNDLADRNYIMLECNDKNLYDKIIKSTKKKVLYYNKSFNKTDNSIYIGDFEFLQSRILMENAKWFIGEGIGNHHSIACSQDINCQIIEVNVPNTHTAKYYGINAISTNVDGVVNIVKD
jgi:hypothetical protein